MPSLATSSYAALAAEWAARDALGAETVAEYQKSVWRRHGPRQAMAQRFLPSETRPDNPAVPRGRHHRP
jgi:hypothetical protein